MNNIMKPPGSEDNSEPDVTKEDIDLMRHIKKRVFEGHDVEIRKASNGKMKVLEISKKNISIG